MSNAAHTIRDFSSENQTSFELSFGNKSGNHTIHLDDHQAHQLRLMLRSVNFRQAGFNGQRIELGGSRDASSISFLPNWIIVVEDNPHNGPETFYIEMTPMGWAELSLMVEDAYLETPSQ